MNKASTSNNQLVPVQTQPKVSSKAVALRKQLGEVATEFDWVAAPLMEILDKTADSFITKI